MLKDTFAQYFRVKSFLSLKSIKLKAVLFLFLLYVGGYASSPRFALVLSGGGARGLCQIGVLKAIESKGIRPDLIVASSMGAIIGALYAAGIPADSIETLARMVDWDKIFSNTSHRRMLFVSQKKEPANALLELRFDYNLKPILPTSVSYGQSFYELLAPLLVIPQWKAGFDFDSLPIPLRIIATDLLSGKRVVFSNGNICTAVRASCAVPLAFSPVEMNGTLLIDGGVSANIPVETAKEMGAEVVAVVDATSAFAKKEELDNPVKLVDQIIGIGIAHRKESEKNKADLIISPDLGNIKKTDFHAIDTLIEIGYRTGMRFCDTVAIMLNSRREAEKDETVLSIKDLSHSSGVTPEVKGIVCIGNKRTADRLLLKAAGIGIGDTFSSELVRNAINSLYATDLFENTNVDLDSSGNCRIMVEEKKYWRLRTGLRFDEFHLGEGYAEPAFENCFGLGIVALMHLHYGLRREKYTFELHSNQLFSRNFANVIQMQLYSSKEKIQQIDTTISDSATMVSTTSLTERTLRKTGISMYFGAQLGRFSLLSGGIRLERFNVQRKDPDMLRDIIGMRLKEILPYFSLKLTMDSMDKYPYPKSGIRQIFSIGGSNKLLAGKYTFIKCGGSIGGYFTFFNYHTFFPSVSFSWADNPLPQVERPFIGGAFSEERYQEMSVYNYIPFYGLPPRAISGDIFGICRLEYRCEVKKNLFTHLFFDWGTAADASVDFNRQLMDDAPMGMGIGLSYMTLLGPFRFSYGRLIKNSSRYVSSRTEFFYFSGGYDF